jgi:hypothetical protein
MTVIVVVNISLRLSQAGYFLCKYSYLLRQFITEKPPVVVGRPGVFVSLELTALHLFCDHPNHKWALNNYENQDKDGNDPRKDRCMHSFNQDYILGLIVHNLTRKSIGNLTILRKNLVFYQIAAFSWHRLLW